MAPRPLHAETHAALETAVIDGLALRVPGRLDRRLYVKVDKVLTALGGAWNRSAQAHLFPSDPAAALAGVLQSGAAPLHQRAAEGFVATPGALADRLIREFTDLGDLGSDTDVTVLEPSAGEGALVAAVLAACPHARVTAVEPNAQRRAVLEARGWAGVVVERVTLEEFTDNSQPTGHLFRMGERFGLVVMNPPFAVPGQPAVWAAHLRMAWDLVSPGGRLLSIVPAGFLFRDDQTHRAARDFIARHGGHTELPEDAFTTSGTGVRTVLVWADRPHAT